MAETAAPDGSPVCPRCRMSAHGVTLCGPDKVLYPRGRTDGWRPCYTCRPLDLEAFERKLREGKR